VVVVFVGVDSHSCCGSRTVVVVVAYGSGGRGEEGREMRA